MAPPPQLIVGAVVAVPLVALVGSPLQVGLFTVIVPVQVVVPCIFVLPHLTFDTVIVVEPVVGLLL